MRWWLMVVMLSLKKCWVLLVTLMIPLNCTCGTPVWLLTPLVQTELAVTPRLQHTPSFLCFFPGISLLSFSWHTSYHLFVILLPNQLPRPSGAVQTNPWPPCTLSCILLKNTWVWTPCPRYCLRNHSTSNNKRRSSWHWVFWNTFYAF